MNKYKHKQTRRDKRLALKRWMVSTSFRAGLLAFTIVFGLLYVVQTSTVSTKGFVISDLQSELQTLEHETRALDVEIAKNRSMVSIQERLQGMDLVDARTVEYVTPVGTVVARR